MNTCVSDDFVVVNLQGIRYVTWGESSQVHYNLPGMKFFVTVTYKGNNQTFHYRTENEARNLFNKIRNGLDKSDRS